MSPVVLHARRVLSGCCLALLALTLPGTARGEPVIDQVEVRVVDPPEQRTDWQAMARSLIYVEAGRPLSAPLLQESIDALRRSGRFQRVEAEVSEEDGAAVLVFLLQPFAVISDIRVRGHSPLYRDEILNHMTFSVGGPFREEELASQEAMVERFLTRQGYISPRAEVGASRTLEGFVVVEVRLVPGRFYRLGRLRIRGNRAYRELSLKLRMRTWRSALLPGSGGRFVEERLHEDTDTLARYYRTHGYPEATVSSTVRRDSRSGTVEVTVEVSEGPRYRFSFHGNRFFTDERLEGFLGLDGYRPLTGQSLDRAVREMEDRYRDRGFTDASVTMEQERGAEEVAVRFQIQEGRRKRVSSLSLEGNRGLGDRRLIQVMDTRKQGLFRAGAFVPGVLKRDLQALRELYRSEGFLDAEVDGGLQWRRLGRKVDVTIRISEWQRTRVSEVEIRGLHVLPEEEARRVLRLREGAVFREHLISEDADTLAIMISERGYPYVRVSGSYSLGEDRSTARVAYTVEEGPPVFMGETWFRGNFTTRERVLRRALEMEPSAPFSLEAMLRTQRNVRDIDVIDSARFTTVGLEHRRERVHLFVDLVERRPYFFEAGGGYQSEEGFFFNTALGNRNLFGANNSLRVGGHLSQTGLGAQVEYTVNRMFGSEFTAVSELFVRREEPFNREIGTETAGASLGANRVRRRGFNPSLEVSLERRRQYLVDQSAQPDQELLEPRSIMKVKPALLLDYRDAVLYTKRGMLSSLEVDVSRGIENSLDNFVRYRLDNRVYLSPAPWITLV
ncbi:MAG: POTRA domain-containing protein, partial [Spirochaetota bacterium]